MNKLLITLAAIVVSTLGWAQTPTKNYVKSTNYQQPVKNQAEIDALSEEDKVENITYYDGLGRPEQSIALQAGGLVSASQTNEMVYDWEQGNFTSSFYGKIGQDTENLILNGTTPFGDTNLLWQCGNDAASDADGGWNTAFQGVDKAKTYRYTVWVKRTGNHLNGKTYHGTKNVNNLDGSLNSNPYFFSGYLPQADTWYLLVGIVHPNTYAGGDTGTSGVYDMQGNKVLNGTEFKWQSNTTVSRFRNYLYYCTDINARQYFWNPLLQQMDGDAYSISEVLSLNEVQQNGIVKDIVTPMVYDDYGRQTKDYLPSPTITFGNFKDNDLVIAEAEAYYLDKHTEDLNPISINIHSEKSLEASPLGRVLEQAAPGADWKLNLEQDTDHTIKFEYESNVANEVSQYLVTFVSGNIEAPQLVYNGSYPINELYKSIVKDENWTPTQTHLKDHTTEEFKNKQGQVVLKRTYNGLETLDTQYVYDDYGNLTYVLSPKGSHGILDANDAVQPTVLDDLCYQYKYDYRNRLVEKKIPGKGWEYIVYDALDRPMLTQDANQRSQTPKQWLFTKYDVFGQVAYTGLYENAGDRGTVQANVKAHSNGNPNLLYESRSFNSNAVDPSTELYYTNNAFPTNVAKLHTINYYDDYSWNVGNGLEASYDFNLSSGLSPNGANISKTSSSVSWSEGFTSQANIEGDGYISFTAAQLNKRVMVGLTSENSLNQDDDYDTIAYAIYLGYSSNRVIIYESGMQQSTPIHTYEVGDTFKIERSGDQILYKKNDEVFYISSVLSANVNLIGDSSFLDSGTTINNVFIGYSYEGQAFTSNTKMLTTGGKVRVLDTDHWTTSVQYYDGKARPIYATSNNTYLNINEAIGSELDFVGKVLKTHQTHKHSSDSPIVTKDVYAYDHTGRLLRQEQQINNHKRQLLVKNSYDALGQLAQKQVGGVLPELSSYANITGVTVSGNEISKTGTNGWNAGLSTQETISGDGYVSYSVSQNNKSMMVGLSYADVNQGYTDLNYAIYHAGASIQIYENGTNKGTITSYLANDRFKIERRGHTIYYLKNDKVFYTSDVPTSSSSMLADITIHNTDAKIVDLTLTDLENGLQDVDYEYNIRGWLKQINDVDAMADDLFGFKLNYNTFEGSASVDKLYNGNISQSIWKTASINSNGANDKKGYVYSYDPLNRILSGKMSKGQGLNVMDNTVNYHLNAVTYDRNGNIESLNRGGHLDAATTSFGTMDDLQYTYDGNKLSKVDDASNVAFGFKDGVNTVGNDYIYDDNGNMTLDQNKGITNIVYNHLNLPTKVVFNNNDPAYSSTWEAIEYVYDATGVKLEKTVKEGTISNQSTTSTKYAGNFIYEDNGQLGTRLKFFSHTEGYIEPTVISGKGGIYLSDVDYVYQYKDHLGNIRLSYSDADDNGDIDAASEIVEENNYYPFGLKHKGYNDVVSANVNSVASKFKYNGKELDESLGLNMYDYHARLYDPTIGRMMQIDPHANKYSPITPYNYTLNSPMNFIDPDGKDFRLIIKKDDDGNFHLTIQTTVHTYGNKSSKETAKFIEGFYSKLGGAKNFGKGNKNSISFDISVQHHDKKGDAIEATKENAGDNLFEINDKISRKDFNLYSVGGDKDYGEFVNNPGFAVKGGREGKATGAISAVHEIGHLLGLGDRYNTTSEGFPINNKGFFKDIMGNGYPSEIKKTHYENLYRYTSKDVDHSIKKGDTRTIPYTDFGGVPEHRNGVSTLKPVGVKLSN